jgi:hypothetical protein
MDRVFIRSARKMCNCWLFDVTIVPGRGRFLFDSTVPGMDRTEFYCTFVLRSLSAKVEEVQIGFPVDSQFAGYSRNESPLISAKESDKWVSDYSFIARDEKATYHVSFVRRKKEAANEFGELFTWERASHQRRRERSPSSTNCR